MLTEFDHGGREHRADDENLNPTEADGGADGADKAGLMTLEAELDQGGPMAEVGMCPAKHKLNVCSCLVLACHNRFAEFVVLVVLIVCGADCGPQPRRRKRGHVLTCVRCNSIPRPATMRNSCTRRFNVAFVFVW